MPAKKSTLKASVEDAFSDSSGAVPKWLSVAQAEVGTIRFKGGDDNPEVLKYFDATTLHVEHDEVPWCSAFVNWCVSEAGLVGTKSALAKSWCSWGVPTTPKPGAIGVINRGDNPSQGHVFLIVDATDPVWLSVVGGNQSNRKAGAQNEVNVKKIRRSALVACRWPKSLASSTTMAASATGTVGLVADQALQVPDTSTLMGLTEQTQGILKVVVVLLVIGSFAWVAYQRFLRWKDTGS